MKQDIFIDVNLKSENSKKAKHLASCIIGVDHDGGMALVDQTTTKNQQVYVIAALRDFADAMQQELNRPENVKPSLQSK
jgi:hypothetical protein